MCSLRMTSPFLIFITATRHISRALSSLRNALPLPTNTLLYFPLADQRSAYLWPVQARHRYGAARLLFANHRLDFSSLLPCHHSSLLPWPLQNNALLSVSFAVTSLRYSFAFPNNAPHSYCSATYLDALPAALPVSTLLSLRRAMRRVASASLCLTMRLCYSARWRVLTRVSACCLCKTFLCFSFSLQS